LRHQPGAIQRRRFKTSPPTWRA